ncbi:PH domain leucine-rich repeat-containing protein phosphatase 1-like [Corythoichthys intestinalis]|uniref:PH domain leucine-rich repeat-containing protein phosphatase 1-like n=1 Tax=Corythoichthys intestinalis TaxID=161448 RepID=UPI0025A57B04|nr:PH domain leucine-rich repeat-containing protein phosphatase 1-like [Corythoichthys intestinalis]XP_057696679.1 PH domain leucine-rich repeat-containing protein phosphatase 1-like [Corythoichthys intestinalis]XP_061791099.1 PH domain leucine-rich repeat-containing protein phosphatase 1-like [Nerophis lumbriciformis]
MERVKEHEFRALSTSQTPQWTPECNNDGAHPKPSGLTALSTGKRPSIGEDEGGGAEAKLLGKGIAATSLLQIAIRNGIYQNQVANAISSGAKNINMPSAKTGNIYNISSVNSSTSTNSLLSKRRQRHKRNLSLGCPPTGCSPGVSPVEAASPAPSVSPLSTLSLDRKTFLRQKQSKQLQASDKGWVTLDLKRGCIHVHDWLTPSYPRPVLCTEDTTAAQVVSKLQASKAEAVLRINCDTTATHIFCKDNNGQINDLSSGRSDLKDVKTNENEAVQSNSQTKLHYFDANHFLDGKTASNSSSEVCLNDIGVELNLSAADCYGAHSGSDMENSTCEEFSLGEPKSTLQQDSLSEGTGLGTDSSALSPNCDSATEGPDPFESSSDELDFTTSPTHSADPPSNSPDKLKSTSDDASGAVCSDIKDSPKQMKHPSKCCGSSQTRPLSNQASVQPDPEIQAGRRGWLEPINTSPTPALFVQLHGGIVRRLQDDERPLQLLNEYLTNLGFEDPWRVQEEGMNPGIGSLIRFYFGKPRSVGGLDRVQLSGVFNVRKGKLVLPVNRWSKRQVTLSGTCLIVSSVKHANMGKIHILPLIGGKVEEVKRHSHCLALSSVGPQSQTYYISYESYTEYLRWHRTASKIVSQRVNSVDLSCCSLEELPTQLFYSHDLTHLYLKNNFMSLHKGIPALTRFCKLRTLSLSNNALPEFPLALCDLPSLTELNLSGNCLSSLPVEVGNMYSLQTLHLDANHLNSLPAALGSLETLGYLGLTFNCFTCIPTVLEKMRDMERLCLAGNQISVLDVERLQWLSTRHIDLRLNRLLRVIVDDMKQLVHIVQLDLRDAGLQELDVRPLCKLEVLHCDRNRLSLIRVSGHTLKSLHAAHNELKEVEVDSVPENLTFLDLSWNKLDVIPDWVYENRRLELLDINHNSVTELPIRLLSSERLRKLLAGWNALSHLGETLERSQLEILDLQHNFLMELPNDLFIKAHNLRYLNVSANKLESLPVASLSEDNLSSLEELYVTNNSLTDKCVPLLTGHGRLRVLHLAYNQLQTFTASKLAQLEHLEELDLSGNALRTVPTTILNCRCLQTLSAHSNCINSFPEVLQLPEIKCVDLSCNELCEITLPESLPPKLQELDLTGNPRLNLDHKSLELLNNIRCLRVDPSPSAPSASECHGSPAVWSHGYTEASGVKNNLCVAALAQDTFCGVREALYGVFDGDRNVEVPYLLQCTMGDVLAEELQKTPRQGDYMTNTFLTMQRKLGTAGQRMGGSAALCHIRHDPVPPGEHGGCFTLKAANVGRCQAVLCRDGKAMQLSAVHTVKEELECQRVRQHNAIITEDNKVSGVTDTTRIMGYSFLCPSVTPRPHISTVTLTPQDEFFLLGSPGLWEMLSPGEAVEAIRNVPDTLAAAKKLVTLAQSYGCSDSLSAVVVQLSITEDCCCFCELLPPPPPSPGLGAHTLAHPYMGGGDMSLPPASSGTVSELSSEFSASEMSSEVGSTASSEDPPPQTEPSPIQTNAAGRTGVRRIARGSFRRQFSGALSDNGLDSEDEEPIPGVFSNGSRVEVEADVHSRHGTAPQTVCHSHSGTNVPHSIIANLDPLPTPNSNAPPPITPSSPSLGGDTRWNSLSRRARANGSVACQGRNQDLIEEAADAPVKKQGGYFNAPAQPDPDDQLIIPPELEDEVRQIIQQQQMETQNQQAPNYQKPADYFITPL